MEQKRVVKCIQIQMARTRVVRGTYTMVHVLRLGHTDVQLHMHSFYIRCHVLLALDFASSVRLLLVVRHEGPGSLQLSATFSGLRRGREGGREGGGGGREGGRITMTVQRAHKTRTHLL